MAIKERKQITGTTSQINAYAGHEGQIVWDKDKKTLVGMSGTAGTNYPLATEAYADNKVSILESKIGTSIETVNEALNNKETKGTCLPLTGGTLTGPLYITKDYVIKQNTTDNYKGLELYGGPSDKKGAYLALRNINATQPNEAGSWCLVSQNETTGQQNYFVGDINSLWFNYKELERIQEAYSVSIDDSGGFCKSMRYTSGLQILYIYDGIGSGQKGRILTFARPFIDDKYAFSAMAHTNRGDVAISYTDATTTGILVYRTSYVGAYDFDTYYRFIAIGRWK